MNSPALYLWFDTEYTDLEFKRARLLQVAAIITDSNLKRLLPPEYDVVLPIKLNPRGKFSDWVKTNIPHLLEVCASERAVEETVADHLLSSYIDKTLRQGGLGNIPPCLAGNSVHIDWWLAEKYLPQFSRRLHYRHLDVTAFKLEWLRLHPAEEFPKENSSLIRKYFPEACLKETENRHDAYYDLQASIAEFAFYREKLLSPL